MSREQFSDAYVEHLMRGPFPGQVDPWSERARYFHQIHNGMISALAQQLRFPLAKMGYEISKEPSLQIAQGRIPDVVIEHPQAEMPSPEKRTYTLAAEALRIETGVILDDDEPDLDAIYIRDPQHTLITVIEVISPRNKSHWADRLNYREERSRLFLQQGVNVVEIDLTRSAYRLLDHRVTRDHAYHTAIFLPFEPTHVLVSDIYHPLKQFALPLRDEVIGVELQAVYDAGYQEAAVAQQIRNREQYVQAKLPARRMLTPEQIAHALQKVDAWQAELAHLRHSQ